MTASTEQKELFKELIKEEFPELMDLIDQSQEGDSFSLNEIAQWLQQNPEKSKSLTDHILDNFSALPLPEEDSLSEESHLTLPEDITLEDITWEDMIQTENDGKTFKLNPIYEALLLERLQFDGDIPELRSKALHPELVPAVSVQQNNLNPILLGLAISDLEEKIQKDKKLLLKEFKEEEKEEASLAHPLEGNNWGEIPKPVPVSSENTVSKRSFSLSKSKKKELAWKVLSTTQGRRSASYAISCKISSEIEELEEWFHTQSLGPNKGDKEFEWSLKAQDKKSFSSDFSFVHMASQIFISKIRSYLEDNNLNHSYFRVKEINNYSERIFGWKVVLKHSV